MTINATAPILLALYVAAAEKQGVARDRIAGTTQNDILKEYIARGTWIYPPATLDAPRDRHLRVLRRASCRAGTRSRSRATTCARPGRRPPRSWRSRSPTRSPTARRPSPAGLAIDDFAPRLSFFFAAWSELFEEVAKFRAARRMWARIVRDRFGSSNARSMACRFHVQTAGSSLTAQSIDNNVVRTTVQALAAVLGGAQSLHTNARDEALALPTEASARLALRTQQILAHESGVTETPDPLAGSYFVETLTDQLEAAAQAYLDEIDAMGGTLAAIEGGFQQRQIQESAYRVQQQIERGDLVVVGVNRFRDDGAGEVKAGPPADRPGGRAPPDRAGPAGPGRARRAGLGGGARAASRTPPAATDNLLPPIIEAVKAYATVGEISDRLRTAFGRPPRADHGLTTS